MNLYDAVSALDLEVAVICLLLFKVFIHFKKFFGINAQR